MSSSGSDIGSHTSREKMRRRFGLGLVASFACHQAAAFWLRFSSTETACSNKTA